MRYLHFLSILLIAFSCSMLLYYYQKKMLSFNTSNPIVITETSTHKKNKIKTKTSKMYAQDLLQAGCCMNIKNALDAARSEIEKNTQEHMYNISFESDSKNAGFVWYSIKDNEMFLDAIYIKKAYRNQGIGKYTLQTLEKICFEQRLHALKLYVFVHNRAAIGLYEKAGYNIFEAYSNEQGDIGFIMKKQLV